MRGKVSIDLVWGRKHTLQWRSYPMVGVKGYATVQLSSTSLGTGVVLPGAFNTASVIQDPTNINAGIIRINFVTAFIYPPVITIQPVRVGVMWLAPGMDPFMPDGPNVHRNVFPLSPAGAAGGNADTILDIPVAQVYENGALPVDGRPMPLSSRIEIEDKLLAHRLLAVERDHMLIQFASYLGQVVRVQPYKVDGTGLDTTDDYQHGTVNEILFGYTAYGDLVS